MIKQMTMQAEPVMPLATEVLPGISRQAEGINRRGFDKDGLKIYIAFYQAVPY